MGAVAIVKRNFLGFTGAVRTMQEHIRCFRRIGYEVDIYSENVDIKMVRQLEAASRKIGFWPLVGNRGRPYFNWRVGRLIHSKDYDLVFGHGELIRQDVVFLHNLRHLAWELMYGKKLPEHDAVGQMHRRVLEARNFRLLMVYTHLMKNDVGARFNVPTEMIEVMYPGLNAADFPLDPDARDRIRNELGIGPDETLVGLITSGCNKKRNIGLFLKAAGVVAAKTNNHIKVLLLGKRASIQAHKNLAAEAGLTSVIFQEPVANIADYYQALDIYVLPAHLEEFGRVVLEAMVYGLPVVVSDRVGAGEILEGIARDGIFQTGREDQLVDQIHRLAVDAEYRCELGRQNRRTAAKYSEPERMKVFLEILIRHGLIPSAIESTRRSS
jgi:UDP-glucose:(heptosyl)LPS alpha-1,3-glucosyltransferase